MEPNSSGLTSLRNVGSSMVRGGLARAPHLGCGPVCRDGVPEHPPRVLCSTGDDTRLCCVHPLTGCPFSMAATVPDRVGRCVSDSRAQRRVRSPSPSRRRRGPASAVIPNAAGRISRSGDRDGVVVVRRAFARSSGTDYQHCKHQEWREDTCSQGSAAPEVPPATNGP